MDHSRIDYLAPALLRQQGAKSFSSKKRRIITSPAREIGFIESMLLVALQLLLLVAGAAADCLSEGCPAAVSPVCGSDGLTYMNECLAMCQGVAVASASSCRSAPGDAGSNGRTTAAMAIHIPAGEGPRA